MYCRVLEVSRQGYYAYLTRQNRLWKYQGLAAAMQEIHEEDICNDTYGRRRMYQALLLKQQEGVGIPSERTVYRVMEQIGLNHHPRRRPNGITKADRAARKPDDLLKRDFSADKPLEKCVTDITELKRRTESCMFRLSSTALISLFLAYLWTTTCGPDCVCERWTARWRPARISEGPSSTPIAALSTPAMLTGQRCGIRQSMNSDGGRWHDNARCESLWARMKCELFYDRLDSESLTVEELKTMIWRYFMSYWNRRRICSANGGLPPLVNRQAYFDAFGLTS